MLKIDPAQAVYGDGERAVVFKNGERVGVIRINKDDSAWLFRVAPDKASIRLTSVETIFGWHTCRFVSLHPPLRQSPILWSHLVDGS